MDSLDALDLDESKSEKFLLKLNSFDKRIEENRTKHSELNKRLEAAINSNNNSEMLTLSNQLLESQESFHRLTMEKNREIKAILSDVEFAKYINFDNRFLKEFFGSCMGEFKSNRRDEQKQERKKK